MKHLWLGAGIVALHAVVAQADAVGVELISNGDFETGTFAGWTVDNLPNSNGNWFIGVPGSATPLSSLATASNPGGGNFYAVADQTGLGTHVLRQSFVVPVNAVAVTLSYQMFVNDSDAGPIIAPAGLDHNAVPNQHSRVDILTATAAPFSTAAADIVANFYLGVDSQATNPNPYSPYVFDITGLVVPGGTYQLRFGEVDNQLFLTHGVDNISIRAIIPEPSALILLLSGSFVLALQGRVSH